MRGSDVNTATGAALWQPSRPAELFKSSGTSARAGRDRRLAPAHRFFIVSARTHHSKTHLDQISTHGALSFWALIKLRIMRTGENSSAPLLHLSQNFSVYIF